MAKSYFKQEDDLEKRTAEAARIREKHPDRIPEKEENKYDVAASEALANKALGLPMNEAVPVYEQLLSTYPTAAKYWKQYVEAYMTVNNDDAVKQIFSRCLLNCLQISLWRCYIRFIRKANEKKGAEGQEETRKAFDFMLNYVGTDIASGPIWMEYIAFLKSTTAMSMQEESQRMTSIRKVYQKAIITPTHHVEQLWKDYENFENSVSRALAKGLISEYQPKYNSTRAVYRERKKYADEIDWNMLAVPPTGSFKEEQQYIAWKKFLAFEKGNPQRIDSTSSNRRISFMYEQCLMYLYHYPDVWYEYATWHARTGSIDTAKNIFQRALKALPDSDMLRYAYAEMEESRGLIQPAKKIYESLLSNGDNATALSHIQFVRFLRRTEGVEAARKYFLDARRFSNCSYHVHVAYAMMAFCHDKDPKVAKDVFEDGLKKFMHEPGYILEYADFLCRLNDDKNIRALFERALSSLPSEDSIEVWNRFVLFEKNYGDLASMLKVEQRRKEALSPAGEDEPSLSEVSLHDVVSRYSFMDLSPCSPRDLDHLTRQEWLVNNANKLTDKSSLSNGTTSIERGASVLSTNIKSSAPSSKIDLPDSSRMIVNDPQERHGTGVLPNVTMPGVPAISSSTAPAPTVPSASGTTTKSLDEILKFMPPAVVTFVRHLPTFEGPSPSVDMVLSILMQANLPPTAKAGKTGTSSQQLTGPASTNSDLSSSRTNPSGSSLKLTKGHSGKRKELNRQEEDDTVTVQSRALPADIFKIRQIQKARKTSSQTRSTRRGATSQTGSAASGGTGSAYSGEISDSTE